MNEINHFSKPDCIKIKKKSKLSANNNLCLTLPGLAALPMRPSTAKILSSYQNNVFHGILKLSPYSPKVLLYFQLGQLPIEAVHHIDVLTLFWCIWNNLKPKIYDILKYLLIM